MLSCSSPACNFSEVVHYASFFLSSCAYQSAMHSVRESQSIPKKRSIILFMRIIITRRKNLAIWYLNVQLGQSSWRLSYPTIWYMHQRTPQYYSTSFLIQRKQQRKKNKPVWEPLLEKHKTLHYYTQKYKESSNETRELWHHNKWQWMCNMYDNRELYNQEASTNLQALYNQQCATVLALEHNVT